MERIVFTPGYVDIEHLMRIAGVFPAPANKPSPILIVIGGAVFRAGG